MAKTRRKRKTYTQAQRTSILSAAQRSGLTALQVQKKFGVTPVTYYSWRKKSGLAGRRKGPSLGVANSDLDAHVRAEVRTKVRRILPGIVRSEVSSYLDSVLGAGRGRRRLKT